MSVTTMYICTHMYNICTCVYTRVYVIAKSYWLRIIVPLLLQNFYCRAVKVPDQGEEGRGGREYFPPPPYWRGESRAELSWS